MLVDSSVVVGEYTTLQIRLVAERLGVKLSQKACSDVGVTMFYLCIEIPHCTVQQKHLILKV